MKMVVSVEKTQLNLNLPVQLVKDFRKYCIDVDERPVDVISDLIKEHLAVCGRTDKIAVDPLVVVSEKSVAGAIPATPSKKLAARK